MKNKNLNEARAVRPWVFETQTPISREEAHEIGDLGTEGDETESQRASEEEKEPGAEQEGGAQHEEAKRKGPGTN